MPLHTKFGMAAGVAGMTLVGTLLAFQLPPFREYPGVEYQLGEITCRRTGMKRPSGPSRA